MARLGQQAIRDSLERLYRWNQEGDRISREYSFADFVEAVEFVDALVEPAEAANHHPDLEVAWGAVTVSLTTHDEGGLTEKDFKLAQTIDQIYQEDFSHE